MALESSTTWQSTWANDVGPADSQLIGAQNIGNWMAARVDNMLDLDGVIPPGPLAMNFTFGKAAFIAAMAAIGPALDQATGAAQIAAAWQTGALASIASTLPGTATSAPPVNSNTFSVVAVTLIDPPSIVAAFASLTAALVGVPVVKDADKSEMPLAFRDAFLALTVTTTGSDSTPSPGGPLPLVDLARGLK